MHVLYIKDLISLTAYEQATAQAIRNHFIFTDASCGDQQRESERERTETLAYIYDMV